MSVGAGYYKIPKSKYKEPKFFDINIKNCTITYKVVIKPFFNGNWTQARKMTFKNKMKKAIESTFNKNNYLIIPKRQKSNCCPCKKGFKPIVKISFTSKGLLSSNWKIYVKANPNKKNMPSYVSLMDNWGHFDEDDVTPYHHADGVIIKRDANGKIISVTKYYQISVVHEFGDFLGLRHPGDKSLHGNDNSDEAYRYRGKEKRFGGVFTLDNDVDGRKDLMGVGSELRPFYFDKWKNKLNSKYGDCNYEIK